MLSWNLSVLKISLLYAAQGTMKILIAEDHAVLASQLQKTLVKQRFSVDIVPDGKTAKDYLDSVNYDLLLLDVGLPKIDGITLCENLRSEGKSIPILMLTGHNTLQDKLRGLNAGGDDYLTKPFETDELIARINALLRRRQLDIKPVLSWGSLSLNQNLNQIYYDNIPLNLTATEHRILALLLLNPHQVFSRQMLIDRIWASTRDIPGDDTVKSHVKAIRRKLQRFNLGNLVKNVYSIGYCLDTKVRDALITSSSLRLEDFSKIERKSIKKSVIIYDKYHSWDDRVTSYLNSDLLASDLLPDLYFDVDAVNFSSLTSLTNHLMYHVPDLLLVLLEYNDDCQKTFGILEEKIPNIASIPWFFVTREQALRLTMTLNHQDSCHIENCEFLPQMYLQNIAYFLAKSHIHLTKKTQVVICSNCKFVLEISNFVPEMDNCTITVVNTFEKIWDIYNLALPIALVIDAKLENSTGINLCRLIRNNPYFNSFPIALIGDGNPYVLDDVMYARVDYFIDRNNIVNELQSFRNWLNQKSYQDVKCDER